MGIKWLTEQTLRVAPGTCWTPQRLGPGEEGCRRQGLRGKGRHDVTAVPVGELAGGFVKNAQRWGCGWRPVAGRDASPSLVTCFPAGGLTKAGVCIQTQFFKCRRQKGFQNKLDFLKPQVFKIEASLL